MTKAPGLQYFNGHIADDVENGTGVRTKATGPKEASAVTGEMHDGRDDSCPTSSAWVLECEKHKGSVSYTEDKANICLMSQLEMQQKAARMNSGWRRQRDTAPTLDSSLCSQLSLCFRSLRQGPSPRSLAISWVRGTFLNRNRLLLCES